MREFLIRLFDTLNGLGDRSSSPMASLERSITAAHHAHASARRALAVAVAEETRETERRLALIAKTTDLEQRAIAALRAGRDDLATQAAETIAAMTTDINASEQASHRFCRRSRASPPRSRGPAAALVGIGPRTPACPNWRCPDRHDAYFRNRPRQLQRSRSGAGKGCHQQSRRPCRASGNGSAGRATDRAHVRCRLRRASTGSRVRRAGKASRRCRA